MLIRLAATLVASLAPHVLASDITLIGTASFPGDALDKSGLTDPVSTFTQGRLGSFGSGIAFLGHDDLYVACDDRGPGDGSFPWRCRFQTFRIRIDPASKTPVSVDLVSTTLLRSESGMVLNGQASVFAGADRRADLRFDPEGIRADAAGSLWISDEYGPWIDHFDAKGARIGRISIPDKFLIRNAGESAEDELPPANTSGRQSNQGFEGLAISPDGSTLWAILQRPLIQDGALSPENKRIGRNCRILEVQISTGKTREFVYQLENIKNGVNEILAINSHELLVIERDGKGGTETEFRKLFRIDLAQATDVSQIASLPSKTLPDQVQPVSKSVWLDFLNPAFGLAGPSMPEKIEGLAFGPMLPDGRRTLIVTIDNDLQTQVPSWFWVFAFNEPSPAADR